MSSSRNLSKTADRAQKEQLEAEKFPNGPLIPEGARAELGVLAGITVLGIPCWWLGWVEVASVASHTEC